MYQRPSGDKRRTCVICLDKGAEIKRNIPCFREFMQTAQFPVFRIVVMLEIDDVGFSNADPFWIPIEPFLIVLKQF